MAVQGRVFTGSRRRVGFGVLLGLLLAAWLSWGPMRALLLGGQASYTSTNSPVGMWVGEMDITSGYNPERYGGTPGPHKHAALYANLDVGPGLSDAFAKRYTGPGELFIAGEAKDRLMQLHLRLDPNDNGLPNADGLIVTDPMLAGILTYCHYDRNTITLLADVHVDLQFKVVLHRGDMTMYHTLLSRLQAEAAHEPATVPPPHMGRLRVNTAADEYLRPAA